MADDGHAPPVGPLPAGQLLPPLVGRGIYLSVVGRTRFKTEAQPAYEAVLLDPGGQLLTRIWPRWIPLDDSGRAVADSEWLESELQKTRWPSLIIWGREDEVFDADTFAARFK